MLLFASCPAVSYLFFTEQKKAGGVESIPINVLGCVTGVVVMPNLNNDHRPVLRDWVELLRRTRYLTLRRIPYEHRLRSRNGGQLFPIPCKELLLSKS
jgi:hypothetical protein